VNKTNVSNSPKRLREDKELQKYSPWIGKNVIIGELKIK
jgi:hypothetical protein